MILIISLSGDAISVNPVTNKPSGSVLSNLSFQRVLPLANHYYGVTNVLGLYLKHHFKISRLIKVNGEGDVLDKFLEDMST